MKAPVEDIDLLGKNNTLGIILTENNRKSSYPFPLFILFVNLYSLRSLDTLNLLNSWQMTSFYHFASLDGKITHYLQHSGIDGKYHFLNRKRYYQEKPRFRRNMSYYKFKTNLCFREILPALWINDILYIVSLTCSKFNTITIL